MTRNAKARRPFLRRERSLDWQLVRLSLALLVPTLAFVGILLWRFAASERTRVEEEARDLSRDFAVALDREINGVLTTLQALATSPSLQTGDLAGFYKQVEVVSRFQDINISLRDTAGHAFLTTRAPYGANVAVPPLLAKADQEVLKTGKATISNIFTSTVAGSPVFQIINAPIEVVGKPTYMLGASINVDYLAEAIRREHLPEGWIGSIVDRNGVFVARTQRHGELAGKPASSSYRQHAVGRDGIYYGTNSESVGVLVGYARSSLTGWTANASVPTTIVNAPLRRSLLALFGLGAMLGLAAVVIALLVGRRLTRAFDHLTEAAKAIGRGQPVAALLTPVAEINRVGAALRSAAQQRDSAEASLLQLTDTLEAQVARKTRERNRLWQSTSDLIGTCDFAGRLQAVNPAWTGVLGWTEHELVGRALLDVVDARDRTRVAAMVADARAGKPVAGCAAQVRTKDGAARTILWDGVPVQDEAIFYLVGRDLTDQRRAEDALRQSQKMEAVGQLTGGIAHDFNNMLAVIIGGLNLVQRRLARGERDVGKFVDAATDGAMRAAALTSRLLAFSRQQPLRPEPLSANDLVAGLSELLRRAIGEDVRLETVLAGGLWRTTVDASQLENAVLNLANNARDAMPDGGKLTIETANAYLDEDYARHNEAEPGQYVLIAVSDSGTGMPAEVVARVFDPFFTTKEVGKGTGLGLSQTYGFVKQSNGHIKIYSEPGHGTTFKIYLPRATGPVPVARPIGAVAPPVAGRPEEIIMVVEDEERVRLISVDALRELGYTVIHAWSGADALQLLESYPDVTLLFTDVVMAGMTGRQLADRVAQLRPGLKVLFTTGFARNATGHNGMLAPGTNFLPKPFTVEQLARKVREVLDD